MAITARLSKAFYERLGEEVVAELVNWMNQVDAASHTGLKELNDLNFARFDAKLGDLKELNELAFARFDAKWGERLAVQDARIADHLRSLEVRIIRWVVGIAIAQTGLFVTILLQTR